MIQFGELGLNPEGKCLIVDAYVMNLSYFERRYITDIYIDSDLTFDSANGPSSKAVHVEIEEPDLKEFYKQFTPTELSNLLDPKELDLKNHIFFVYVYLDGPVVGTIPCGMDKDMYIGVAVNWDHLYHESLQYMKQIDDCCNIPKDLIDFILRIKALELAIKTGHYDIALASWKRHFNKKSLSFTSGCGCSK